MRIIKRIIQLYGFHKRDPSQGEYKSRFSIKSLAIMIVFLIFNKIKMKPSITIDPNGWFHCSYKLPQDRDFVIVFSKPIEYLFVKGVGNYDTGKGKLKEVIQHLSEATHAD